MLFLLIIVTIILILMGLLFVPILICIDTDKDLYYIQLRGVFKISAKATEKDILQIRIHTFLKDFYFYPLRKKHPKKKKSKKTKSNRNIPFIKVFRLLKSFRVKRLYLDIDTGNCITNAKLYPLFAFLNYRYGGFNINFNGRTKLLLYLENRPIRILTSFINF